MPVYTRDMQLVQRKAWVRLLLGRNVTRVRRALVHTDVKGLYEPTRQLIAQVPQSGPEGTNAFGTATPMAHDMKKPLEWLGPLTAVWCSEPPSGKAEVFSAYPSARDSSGA